MFSHFPCSCLGHCPSLFSRASPSSFLRCLLLRCLALSEVLTLQVLQVEPQGVRVELGVACRLHQPSAELKGGLLAEGGGGEMVAELGEGGRRVESYMESSEGVSFECHPLYSPFSPCGSVQRWPWRPPPLPGACWTSPLAGGLGWR